MDEKGLREFYAGLAMMSLLYNRIEDTSLGKVIPTFADDVAKDAVTFADALIRKLEEK